MKAKQIQIKYSRSDKIVMVEKTPYRFLFAGGGTGGHLFPAIAIAEQIRNIIPEAEILFIGTKSKIEGTIVPQHGFKFKSIWIKGFSRKITFDNMLFPLKLLVSTIQSILINIRFKPKVAIGSGGYVSGPAILGSTLMGSKIILTEQNSYPGKTTKFLEKYADEIHISFEDSKKYFRNQKVLFFTGNPVRANIYPVAREAALKEFNLSLDRKTLFVSGGSLGARSINDSIALAFKEFDEKKIQIIWQTGNKYYETYKNYSSQNIIVLPFIVKIDKAYSACDLFLARAGATTIAEILTLGIASILVPSPNVTENHQYYNAKSLSDKGAAILLEDNKLKDELTKKVLDTIYDEEQLKQIRSNALLLAKPKAAEVIARSAIKYARMT